jgi:hypothetical protein
MRNLMEYPITTDEISECLGRHRQAYIEKSESEMRIGDTDGACLTEAISRTLAYDKMQREIIQCAVELEEAAKLLKRAANLPGVAGIYERAAVRARRTLGVQ